MQKDKFDKCAGEVDIAAGLTFLFILSALGISTWQITSIVQSSEYERQIKENYRAGYIQALLDSKENKPTKYYLEDNPDGTRTWKERK